MRLRSVKEESDASRLRSLKGFLYDDWPFLRWHGVFSRKDRESIRRGKETVTGERETGIEPEACMEEYGPA